MLVLRPPGASGVARRGDSGGRSCVVGIEWLHRLTSCQNWELPSTDAGCSVSGWAVQ